LKTHHDITEIVLNLTLITNQSIFSLVPWCIRLDRFHCI